MITAVWVASPERAPRGSIRVAPWGQLEQAQTRRPHLVPTIMQGQSQWPEWLLERMSGESVDVPAIDHGRGGHQHLQLLGVAKLSARGVRFDLGLLFDADDESKVLLSIYRNPLDAALIKVTDAAPLLEPITVTHRYTSSLRKRLMRVVAVVVIIVVTVDVSLFRE